MFEKRPRGVFPGEFSLHSSLRGRSTKYAATGEFRSPRKGEYYLSGAIIVAYRTPNDLNSPYWIAVPVEPEKCPTCGHVREYQHRSDKLFMRFPVEN